MASSEYPEDGLHTYDKEAIIGEVVSLLQERVDWHGYRPAGEVENAFDRKGVVWSHRGGEIACVAVFRHLEQQPHTRVYQTAMSNEHWDPAMWESLVRRVVRDSPHRRVLAKAVDGEAEDDLWAGIGQKVAEEPSKHRRLNVWLVDDADYSEIREW